MLAAYVLPRLLARSLPQLLLQVPSLSSLPKELYTPRGFIAHAASLHQGFPHCARFPTAASRRSLARASVRVWPCALSGRLPFCALVGSFLSYYLIGRGLLSQRLATFPSRDYAVLAPVSQGYSTLRGRLPTCYSPVRHYTRGLLPFPVRLACVRSAASVDSEPGSNSHFEFLSCFAPALLRNTDEFFFTASNQIVKDLRSPTPASCMRWPATGLEIRSGHSHRTCGHLQPGNS